VASHGEEVGERRRRPRAANVATGIVALAFALAASEAVMAWLDLPEPPTNVSRVRGVKEKATIPGLRTQLAPHARWVHEFDSDPRGYFGDGVEYAINSFGARDREYPRAKPPGTRRIVAMGDSFTFGTGVHAEDTFAKRLEALLAELGDGSTIEVINFGVPGYNTPSEVILLEHLALSFSPDVVLISIFLNDAGGDIGGGGFGTVENLGVSQQEDWPSRHSRMIRAVRSLWRKRAVARRLIASYHQSFGEDFPGWRAMRSALERAAALQQSHGYRLVGVIWPVMYSLDEDYPFMAIHEKLARTFGSLGVPVLDLLSHFRGRDARDLWVHRTNQHPNEECHAIAARAILEHLEEGGILPWP
jgi:lysophospholipase L1-like esterase